MKEIIRKIELTMKERDQIIDSLEDTIKQYQKEKKDFDFVTKLLRRVRLI